MAQKSNTAAPAKDFDFETMAVVVCCLLENGVTLGMKQYQLMATLSGNRTASSFDHQFRKVKSRARELQQEFKASQAASTDDAPTTPQTNGNSTPGKSGGKRGRKNMKGLEEDQDDGMEESGHTSKKVKKEEVDDF